jgi:hypothetical protein
MPGRIWLCLLGLAQHSGWEPRGTLPPEPGITDEPTPEFFDGCYYPPFVQRIHVDDVLALASALEDALLDIPDIDTDSPPTTTEYWTEQDGPVLNVLTELSGRNKAGLREFIAHCREGGEIWIC